MCSENMLPILRRIAEKYTPHPCGHAQSWSYARSHVGTGERQDGTAAGNGSAAVATLLEDGWLVWVVVMVVGVEGGGGVHPGAKVTWFKLN